MTSGRDKMMEQWGTDQEEWLIWQKKQMERMIGYRQTLITELQRIDTEIVKIEMELEEHDE